MKKGWFALSALIIGCTGIVGKIDTTLANDFTEEKIDPQSAIAVAIPFGYKDYKLEIIEQIPDRQQCWSENGTSPVTIDLLLLDFDHTESCRRIKNSNGYSVRLDGKEEKSSLYLIDVVQRDDEIQLIAQHENPDLPELIIGRSNGLAEGALKINLDPGWEITKRNFQGETLGHVYLSGNSQLIGTNPQNPDLITKIPAPPDTPISEALPNLIPDSSPEEKQMRDDRPGSDTEGSIVVRDRIDVVFEDGATVEEVNNAIGAIDGGIDGSFEGGTIVSIKIPDPGDLSGIDNARDTLIKNAWCGGNRTRHYRYSSQTSY